MVPDPNSALLASLEAAFIAASLLLFGFLLAHLFTERLDLGRAAQWGLAFPSLLAYVALLMVAHIVTGGNVFTNAVLVRSITAIVFVGAAARWFVVGRRGTHEPRAEQWVVMVMAVLGVVVWCSPALRMFPLLPLGDNILHSGWASQLVAGHSTPSGPITGDIPNAYPWLHHALLATISLFMPGGRTLTALHPLLFLQVAGSALTLYGLGREVTETRAGGVAAALFGAIAGGFGWARFDIGIVTDPRADPSAFFGDLLARRPYNAAFHNLAPPFPRDVAFILVSGFLLLLVVAMKRRRTGVFVAAGTVLGLIGLTGGETFIFSLAVASFVSLWPLGAGRVRVTLALFVPALLVYALWLGPVAINYTRLGGLVNITGVPPVVLTPLQIAGAWGLTLLFGIYGLVLAARRAPALPGPRVALLVTAVGAVAVLSSPLIPKLFGDALLTLGRQHRYWPLLYLAVALCAAVGVADLWTRIAPRRFLPAAGSATLVMAMTVASPVIASVALPDATDERSLLTEAATGADTTLLNLIAPAPGMMCRAAVPPELDWFVFAHTGFPLVRYQAEHPPENNEARIRWADIYEHIPGDAERRADNRALVMGWGTLEEWNRLAGKYDVDVVVAPVARAGAAAFAELSMQEASDGEFVVVRVDACG